MSTQSSICHETECQLSHPSVKRLNVQKSLEAKREGDSFNVSVCLYMLGYIHPVSPSSASSRILW